uniref:Cyclin n=1 Tax=Strombidinopsis acuminata TaxID=141414 RepID=A0A7S3RJ16_9SPIT|mmetsp:Transcript_29369/g.89981  ORF Transcript_29369/g.89981 Transcript_29369/m.89981 type:complete len:217 (-) Transcript_29369:855-1505(-)
MAAIGRTEASSGSPDVIVSVMSKLLEDLVSRNDQLPLAPSQVTPFHSSKPPAITVRSYLEDRILKYAGCSEETFILALIYIDQVVQFNPDFIINSLNVHRLLITSIMLASKFFDDVYYNNAYYARVGGISNVEVNSLEMEMLRMISFSLFVQTDQYERYRASLYSHVGIQSQPVTQATGPGSMQSSSAHAEAGAGAQPIYVPQGGAGGGGVEAMMD